MQKPLQRILVRYVLVLGITGLCLVGCSDDDDDDNGEARNVAPRINAVTNNGPINEGGHVTITVHATDPDNASDLQYAFDCDNDNTFDIGPQAGNTARCPFGDDGNFPINVRVSDPDDAVATDRTIVAVRNVLPTITTVTGGEVAAGASLPIEITATDPAGDNDPLRYEWDCNNDGTFEIGPRASNSAPCPFPQPGTFQVGVRVSDDTPGATFPTDTATVNVVLFPDVTAPLASMVALVLRADGGTGATTIPAFVRARVDQIATNTLPAGARFPVANTTDDTLRTLPELQSSVVARWLDPLTNDTSPEGLRYGSNNDFIAYFGDGWDADWTDDVVRSAPQFNGSGTAGWIWSNHEYISNDRPTTTSAPTGQHLTLARFMQAGGLLTNDVEADVWPQGDVNRYIRFYKRQLGGSWFRAVQGPQTLTWRLERHPDSIRYDATDNTLVRVTGQRLNARDHDDANTPLLAGVVVGIAGNCSGAQTPWGTVLSGEENVQDYYGDLETAWTSDQAFVPGAGFDPGSNVTPMFAASTDSQFGAISNPAQRHERDIYGYLSEIDPGAPATTFYRSANIGGTGRGHRKIGSLGRARWENAAIAVGPDFRLLNDRPIVIYGGDDRRGGRIYKWVSAAPYQNGMTRAEVRALLDTGALYVAHFAGLDHTTGTTLVATGQPPTEADPGEGRWLQLSVTSTDIAPNAAALGNPTMTIGAALQDVNWNGIGGFLNDDAVRRALFTASNKIGIAELNRPEDIEWNPNDLSGTPRLYVAFTNHTRQVALNQDGVLFDPATHSTESPQRDNPCGTIFALQEVTPTNPATSTTFRYFQVWAGTEGTGPFDACDPDNLMLDGDGGVWFVTDGNFGVNGTADALYYLDLDPAHRAGPTFGVAFRIMAGPSDSESTGPVLSSDMRTIFVNIQHPGEDSAPSTWPPR